MSTIRCFIAIEIGPDVGQLLASLGGELSGQVRRGAVRWVNPGNIHLTLKFLGDTDAGAIGQIGGLVETVCADVEPFCYRLGKLGCFPNPRRPRVIWVGVEEDGDALTRLHRGLEHGLADLGWAVDGRRFHPHLTLGRVKDSRAVVDARFAWGTVKLEGQQRVGDVCLFQRDLRPSGAVYTVLKRAKLAGRIE